MNMPEETDPDEEDVEVLFEKEDYPYRRQEVWTDGEWLRLGRDVLGDRYLEVRVEEMRDLIDTLRAQTGVERHTVTDSRGSDEKYIAVCDYSLDLYRDRKHILHHSDHEYGVLYTALNRALEMRETFDYEQLARSYAESIKRDYWPIRDIRASGRGFGVEVVDEDGRNVNLSFVDELREDEHIDSNTMSVYIDDGSIVYQFTVHPKNLPGAPDDE
jgi:hypothetical protein